MLARTSLFALVLPLTLAGTFVRVASAQSCMNRMQAMGGSRGYLPAMQSAMSRQPMLGGMRQMPSLQNSSYAGSFGAAMPSMGQSGYSNSYDSGAYDPYALLREAQMQRIAQAQQRRDAEQARRKAVREKLPPPIQNEEQLAAKKFQMAHLLWQGGNTPAARKWLSQILEDFPTTSTADRARQTLTNL